MFYFSKKSIIITVIIVVFITSILSAMLIEVNRSDFSYARIVIDAGHGGWDGGSVSKNGTVEAELTLEIAKMLKKKLEKNNFSVTMTREDRNALADKKLDDMKKRANIIKESGPDAVISIHINKYKKLDRRGVQVFFDDTGIGYDFAKLMQDSINVYFNSKYSGNSDLECLPGDFYITKCVFVPSIIVECGFLSNKEDEKLLNTKKYKEELTDCISKAVCSIFINDSV